MSDTAQNTETEVPQAPAAQTAQSGSEIDWKAEARKWEERAKANKAAADERDALKAQIEKQGAEYKTLAEQMEEIKKQADERAAEAARYRVAASKGVPADLLPETGDEETLAAFADKVLAFRAEAEAEQQRMVVPGVGSTPPKPPTPQERARAAEQAGDFATSMREKANMLADLAAGQTK
jgi:hypothetical protein